MSKSRSSLNLVIVSLCLPSVAMVKVYVGLICLFDACLENNQLCYRICYRMDLLTLPSTLINILLRIWMRSWTICRSLLWLYLVTIGEALLLGVSHSFILSEWKQVYIKSHPCIIGISFISLFSCILLHTLFGTRYRTYHFGAICRKVSQLYISIVSCLT